MDSFKDFLLSMLGTYSPVTYSVVSGETVSEVIPAGLSGVDWPWVLGALCFCICLYSFFRLLGIVLKR